MEDIKTKALQAHSEGRLLEAERCYRILLEQSDDPDVAVNLGALLRSQKRLQEGSTHYHRCLKRWPNQRNLILNACNCWKDTGENATALHWLRHALRQDPDDTELVEALAEILALADETAEAIGRYESVLQADPRRIQSWLGLGLVHARSGSCKQARPVTERCFRSIRTNRMRRPISSPSSSKQETFSPPRT